VISKPSPRDYLAISLFHLAVSFFWGAILYVVLQSLIQTLVAAELGSTVPAALREGVAVQRLGYLQAAGSLVAVTAQLVFGALSDISRWRIGRRKPYLIFGTVMASLGIACLPFLTSYVQLFALFLGVQFWLNVAIGPYQALLPDLIAPEYHGTASAYMGLATLVGRTGGMVASGLLLQNPSGLWTLTILFLVLINGLMLATAILTRETPLPRDASTHNVAQTLRSAFRFDLRGQSSFVWVLVSRFVVNIGIYTIMPILQYYLINTLGLSKNEALAQQAYIALTVNIAGLVATFPAGKLSDRFSKKAVLYFTCAVSMVGGLSFALAGSPQAALLAAAIFGLGYGAFTAVDWALVCNVLPPGGAAKYMGLWGFADIVPQIVAPFIGGLFAAWSIAQHGPANGYRYVMFLAIFWFALGTLCLRFVRERRVHSVTLSVSD
jgi:MFS family permease